MVEFVSFLFAIGVGFGLSCWIFGTLLNKSNNIGDSRGANYEYNTNVNFTSRIDSMSKSESANYIHYHAVKFDDSGDPKGTDLVRRLTDEEREAREKGHPWEICKGFDGSAVIGDWVEKEKFLDVQALHFHLDINGQTVQEGCTSDMLYKIDELIAYISQFFTLKTGDLLYTGTPVGVGPVKIDDHLEGWLEDRKVLSFNAK